MQALGSDDPSHLGGYQLLARLGAGGMGQVYLARSPGGRTVALKAVRSELTADRGFRARFRREVDAARRVSGAFTAPVVDADPDAEVPWLATAYVPGPSLADAVADEGPLPELTVRTLAAGLAEAVAAVHAAGLVHRDLKPSNVLLSLDGPRLIDFGISRAADDTGLTGTGLVVGSPGYMSPEQAAGTEIGPASDVFSLGSVLVYAATGLGPFGSGSAPSLLYRVVHNAPALDSLPAYLRPIVEPCLAKAPAQRPTLAQVMARALPDDTAAPGLGGTGWLPARVAEQAVRHQTATGAFGSPAWPPPPSAVPPTYVHRSPAAPPPPPGRLHGTGTYTHIPPIPGPPPAPTSPPPAGQSRRALGRRGFVLAGAAAAAAIAGGGAWLASADGDRRKPAARPATPPAAPPAAVPVSPSPEMRNGKPVYRIGVQVSVKNGENYPEIGETILRAATVACAAANDAGGLPFYVDPRLIANEGLGPDPSLLRNACEDPRLLAVIGPEFTSDQPRLGDIYRSTPLAAVTVSGTAMPRNPAASAGMCLRAVDLEDRLCADLAAYVVRTHRPARVHLIDPGVIGTGLTTRGDRVADHLTAAGVTVTGKADKVPPAAPGASPWPKVAQAVKAARADVVVYSGYGPNLFFVNDMVAASVDKIPYVGFHGVPEPLSDLGANPLGKETDPFPLKWEAVSVFADAVSIPAFSALTSRYQQTYQAPPGLCAAETFDVTNMIIDTLKALGPAPTRRAVLDTLRRTTYQGAARTYAFDADGYTTVHATHVYRTRGRAMEYVGRADS